MTRDRVRDIERWRLHVDGVVQGVGFRPFVYGLATRYQLSGWVLNSSAGVEIEAQGAYASLDALVEGLQADPPPLSIVRCVNKATIPIRSDERIFAIRESHAASGISLVPADTATCPACLEEIFDPTNRRYRYPFTNCTHCGPRYTIIRTMPYDRGSTTMAGFALCPVCRAEYEDPFNRRFHAQPNACPLCGPRVELVAPPELGALVELGCADDIARAASLLRQGHILAIKGVGGFHLACDATNQEAVARLRQRKARPHKPLAVMVATLEEANLQADIHSDEAALMSSAAAPIVLVDWKASSTIAHNVAPGSPALGIMLAYTPLHHILLSDTGIPLVMTSGNMPGLPIVVDNSEALSRLAGIADAFLTHNRPIHTRCDDAVWAVSPHALNGQPIRQPVRRARGDAPKPVRLPWSSPQHVLAVGGEMKNTLCLLREQDAFLSQHLGEVESAEAVVNFRDTLTHLIRLFDVEPMLIAHDLHPGYRTSALAEELSNEWRVPRLPVQHHHAHIAACMAEHGRDGQVIGVAFDGTGYGPDGTIWGGEILIASLNGYERAAHLESLPLPGGDAAIRRPYRTALSYLLATQPQMPDLRFIRSIADEERQIILRQIERGVNTSMTSSCGRLFDAVAAMTGLCAVSSFEGQAAMALEAEARTVDCATVEPYPFRIDTDGTIRVGEMLEAIASDVVEECAVRQIAGAFHLTVADIICKAARGIRAANDLNTVALSGGVFQNRLLAGLVRQRLLDQSFEVLEHQQVPANDGGLSLGQAAVALRWLEDCDMPHAERMHSDTTQSP